jgi:hypothetical protein
MRSSTIGSTNEPATGLPDTSVVIDHDIVDAARLPESTAIDAECARAYGRLYATLRASGRSPRTRVVDLLIAATALAYGLPVYTRNPDDLQSLRPHIQVLSV